MLPLRYSDHRKWWIVSIPVGKLRNNTISLDDAAGCISAVSFFNSASRRGCFIISNSAFQFSHAFKVTEHMQHVKVYQNFLRSAPS